MEGKATGEQSAARAVHSDTIRGSLYNLAGDIIRHQRSKPFGFALDFDPWAGPKRRVYYFNAGAPRHFSASLNVLLIMLLLGASATDYYT